jgi:hypothetical protein
MRYVKPALVDLGLLEDPTVIEPAEDLTAPPAEDAGEEGTAGRSVASAV